MSKARPIMQCTGGLRLEFYTGMNIHCDLAATVFVVAKLDSVPASVVVQCAPVTFLGRFRAAVFCCVFLGIFQKRLPEVKT